MIKDKWNNIRPIQTTRPYQGKELINQDLRDSSHVHLIDDIIRKTLKPSHSGPHAVISRGEKMYTITIQGRSINVKLAFDE